LKLNKIINYALILFSLDILLTSSGNWTNYIGINIRKVLFIAICFITTIFWLRNLKITKKELEIQLLLILFLIIWGWVIPLIAGTEVRNSLGDSLPFYGILFLIPIYEYINYYISWDDAKIFIFRIIKTLAIIHILLMLLFYLYEFDNEKLQFINNILEGGANSINIGYRPDFGVLSGSSIFLFIGLYLALTSKKKSFLDIIIIISAIILTGTRSLGIGAVLLILFYLVKNNLNINSKKIILGFTFFLVSITIPIVVIIKYGFFNSSVLSRDVSDEYRVQQISGIIEKIINNPFFGIGFGGHTDLVSNESAPYSYELSILALMMKLGIIGTIFLATIFYKYMSNSYNCNLTNYKSKRNTFWFLTVVIIVFIANTNPYLFSFLGFYLISFFYIEYRNINE
jgi:hypothetical protein